MKPATLLVLPIYLRLKYSMEMARYFVGRLDGRNIKVKGTPVGSVLVRQ